MNKSSTLISLCEDNYLYHSSEDSDIQQFKPFLHVGSRKSAIDRSEHQNVGDVSGKTNYNTLYKLEIKDLDSALTIADIEGEMYPREFINQLFYNHHITNSEFNKLDKI